MTPEERKAYNKAYYQAKKDKAKAYYQANKEKMIEYQKAYYHANKENVLQYQKAYYQAKKEKKTTNTIATQTEEVTMNYIGDWGRAYLQVWNANFPKN